MQLQGIVDLAQCGVSASVFCVRFLGNPFFNLLSSGFVYYIMIQESFWVLIFVGLFFELVLLEFKDVFISLLNLAVDLGLFELHLGFIGAYKLKR